MEQYKMDIDDIEAAFNKNKFTKEINESKDFFITFSAFVILAVLGQFFSFAEKHPDYILIKGKKDWIAMLQIYYLHFHGCKNRLIQRIKGEDFTNGDRSSVREALYWAINIMEHIFLASDEERPIPVFLVIAAGRIYTECFYLMNSINSLIYESLGLNDQYKKAKGEPPLVMEEVKIIINLEERTITPDFQPSTITEKEEMMLEGIWVRTIEFVKEGLNEARKAINDSEFPIAQ